MRELSWGQQKSPKACFLGKNFGLCEIFFCNVNFQKNRKILGSAKIPEDLFFWKKFWKFWTLRKFLFPMYFLINFWDLGSAKIPRG
jgi:hypothetical protein